jgi:signal transduction histidine kinase/CheY-like chemotaxis protein
LSVDASKPLTVQSSIGGAEVRAELVRTIYRQSTPVLVANCINAGILSAALWGTAPRSLLLLWSSLVALMALVRARLWKRYREQAPPASEAAAWGGRFVAGSAVAGVLWGAAGFWMLHSTGPVSELLVIFMVGGMCTAAAGTLAAYFAAFVAFTTPALTGLALGLVLFGDSLHQLLGGLVVLYGAGLSVVARVNHRALTDAFTLRCENAELVASLSRAQSRLEESNRSLEQRVAERTAALGKQAEALREARRLEAVGRLAGGVAHDFNNLLTINLANISELMARRALDSGTHIALVEMRDSCMKGAELVRQLLTFGRRQRTNPETLDLNQVLHRLERLLGRLLGERLTLDLDLEAAQLFVCGDPTQVEQVIINLITNARDAMLIDGVVAVQSRAVDLVQASDGLPPGKYVLLTVTDTGAGMDAETRQHIFEPFFTTKEVGKGTGLGLATAHSIVEQSGGYIRVTSTPGQGSCFKVYLPAVAPPAEQQSDAEPRAASGMRKVARPSRATVLLVEDEPTVRSVARRILMGAGYQVLAAPSGEQALTLAAAHDGHIDLLVTDILMAGFDGLELASRLRAIRPELRTLFMSGYSRHHAVPRDDASHGVGFLAKPFTYELLLGKVMDLLAAPANATAEPSSLRVRA